MSSRGAALQASVAKSCMPPKALSRFAELGEIRGRRHRRARWTFHSGQNRVHAHEPRSYTRLSGEARDRLWRSGSRPRISVNSPSTPCRTRLGLFNFFAHCRPWLPEVSTALRELSVDSSRCTRTPVTSEQCATLHTPHRRAARRIMPHTHVRHICAVVGLRSPCPATPKAQRH